MDISHDAIITRAIGQRLEEDRRLIDAIVKKDTQQLRRLLQFGVNPNGHPMSVRGPPMHLAAQQGSLKCVKLLVDAGAKINNSDGPYGSTGFRQVVTPLHVAVKHSNVGMVRLLALMGADIDIPDRDGFTVRELVSHRKDLCLVVEQAVKERQNQSWSQASVNFNEARKNSSKREHTQGRQYEAGKLQLHDSCKSMSRANFNQPKTNHPSLQKEQHQQQKIRAYSDGNVQNRERISHSTVHNVPHPEKLSHSQQSYSKNGSKIPVVVSRYEQQQQRQQQSSGGSSSSLSGFTSFYQRGVTNNCIKSDNPINLNNVNNKKSIESNHSRNQTQYYAQHQNLHQYKQIGLPINVNQSETNTGSYSINRYRTNTSSTIRKVVRPVIPKLDLSKVKPTIEDSSIDSCEQDFDYQQEQQFEQQVLDLSYQHEHRNDCDREQEPGPKRTKGFKNKTNSIENDVQSFCTCRSFTTSSSSTNNTISLVACV
eukprot:TRINITY_DN2813_c0_g2_i1.p2 TRINITY_DN2813_c0_g2~~TRINITY_DN2813_c0_g2_i1.p2  ORF type:complete len:482 (+),score=41.31 TRINITY_DN2813_c0_g2_i1:211-1656(+)